MTTLRQLYGTYNTKPQQVGLTARTRADLAEKFLNRPAQYQQALAKALLAAIRGALDHGSRQVTAEAQEKEVAVIVGVNLTPTEWAKVKLCVKGEPVDPQAAQDRQLELKAKQVPFRKPLPTVQDLIDRQSAKSMHAGPTELPWNRGREIPTAEALPTTAPLPLPAELPPAVEQALATKEAEVIPSVVVPSVLTPPPVEPDESDWE